MLDIVYWGVAIQFIPDDDDTGFSRNMLIRLSEYACEVQGELHFDSTTASYSISCYTELWGDVKIKQVMESIAAITHGIPIIFKVETIENSSIMDRTSDFCDE